VAIVISISCKLILAAVLASPIFSEGYLMTDYVLSEETRAKL
jgi:hypothetical protein